MTTTKPKGGDATDSTAFAGYVPKPIQLELRKAWRLIHIEGKYKEGMAIIIDLSGMPENRIDWKAHNGCELSGASATTGKENG